MLEESAIDSLKLDFFIIAGSDWSNSSALVFPEPAAIIIFMEVQNLKIEFGSGSRCLEEHLYRSHSAKYIIVLETQSIHLERSILILILKFPSCSKNCL